MITASRHIVLSQWLLPRTDLMHSQMRRDILRIEVRRLDRLGREGCGIRGADRTIDVVEVEERGVTALAPLLSLVHAVVGDLDELLVDVRHPQGAPQAVERRDGGRAPSIDLGPGGRVTRRPG